jgi:DNA end-binding protein Ku
VEPHNKGRGYEVGENQFMMVQDEELAAARQEARTRPFSAAPPLRVPVADSKDEPRKREAAPNLAEITKREEEPAPPVVAPRPIENNRTIDLDRFVRGEQIDPRYYPQPLLHCASR